MADNFLPKFKLSFMPDISPFTGVLGNRLAAYLLRRTTMGPSKAQILSFAAMTPQQAVSNLLTVSPIANSPIDPATNATWVNVVANQGTDDVLLRDYVVTWMLDNFRTDNTIRSKMILFLHQNWMVDEQIYIRCQDANTYYIEIHGILPIGAIASLCHLTNCSYSPLLPL